MTPEQGKLLGYWKLELDYDPWATRLYGWPHIIRARRVYAGPVPFDEPVGDEVLS